MNQKDEILNFETAEESFWAGSFGSDYIKRNNSEDFVANKVSFFRESLKNTSGLKNILEFGSNIGLNLKAISQEYPDAKPSAVEINLDAVSHLKDILPEERIFHQSILEFKPQKTYDLVFTKGVLIHINPAHLNDVYQKMYESSHKYILICEYYDTNPSTLPYRGFSEKLYKRDFAGEILNKFSDLSLIDYGFCYHMDAYSKPDSFRDDDITYFLLQKAN